MNGRRRSIPTLLAVAITALAIAGCTPQPAPQPSASPPQVLEPETPSATPEPSPSATTEAEASCATILPDETVADFEALGWTAREEPLYVGGTELVEGLQCTWGDYSVATDHVQIFGWAPISDTQAATAQEELLETGWRREDSADGVYITESAETAIATDDEGYGITYLFGEGWVTVADTKQGLLLIEPPTG